MKVIAVPNITSENAVSDKLICRVVLRSTLAITGMEITAMIRLITPAPIVAS